MIGSYNILIVEDSNFMRLALRKCLESNKNAPMDVTEAYDGIHALEILSSQSFDLIMTDLEMPKMDGLSLISELRRQSRFDEIPIIFLTSVDDANKKVTAFEFGATDYVMKPFTAEELIARILAHLERKFMTEAIRKKAIVSENLTHFYRNLSSINLQELEHTLMDLLTNHLRIGSIALWEFEASDQQLYLKIASDELPPNLPIETEKKSFMWQALQEGKPIFLEQQETSTVNSLGFSIEAYTNSPITILPLFIGDNQLGVLNLTNFPSDFFSQYELNHLESLQHFLSNALQNAFSYHIIHEKQRQTEEELEQAKRTQLTILPSKIPQFTFIDIATRYVSMEQIGGDLYDIFEFKDNKVGIMVADVTGHGIPAALISCMSSSLFRAFASDALPPENVIAQINQELHTRMPDGKFVTAFYAVYDAVSKALTYTIAGHPQGYVVRGHSKEVIQLNEPAGLPLGIFSSDMAVFEADTVTLQENDRVFLYTDGIVEIANPEGEMYGYQRLETFLLENHDAPLDSLLDELYTQGLKYSKKPAFDDDITFLAFEVK